MIPRHPSVLFALVLATGALAPAAYPQWSDDNTVNQAVVTRTGDQAVLKSAATSDGGCWVGWFDNASGNYDVYVQRYDAWGYPAFPAGGLLVSNHAQSSSLVNWSLIADSSDNVVLAFTDTRDGGDLDVHAYKISSAGTFKWGANGVTLSSNADFEADPMVAEATNGDFVFVWGHYPSGDGEILMQRLAANGSVLLTAGGVSVASGTGEDPGFADIVPSASGSVIVSWVRDIAFSSSVKDVRAERFNSAGASVWGAPVEVFDAFNVPIAYSPKTISDEAGGAVIAWHASNPGSNLFESYAQRLDLSGNELFAHNGVSLSLAASMHHLDPTVCFRASTGEIFAFWTEKNSAQSMSGLHAQKLNASGVRQWAAGGAPLLLVDGNTKFPARSVQIGDGAMAVLTWEPTGTFGQDQILAIRVDTNGDTVWSGNTRTLCGLNSGKSVRLGLARSSTGETVVFWEDDRNGSDDVYGQNIHPDGTLGESLLTATPGSVSLSAGGSVLLELDGGVSQAGRSYWLLGTISGTSPGINSQGMNVPLNNDVYFQLTLNNPNHPLLAGFRDNLNFSGLSAAGVTIPAGYKPGLAGRTVYHAYVVLTGGTIQRVSNPAGFTLTP